MSTQEQSINQDIDQMVGIEQDLEEVTKEITPLATAEDVLQEDVSDDIAEEIDQDVLVPTGQPTFIDEEPTKVAGIIPKVIKKVTTQSEDFADLMAKRSKLPSSSDEYLIIPNATDDEVNAVLKSYGDTPVDPAAEGATVGAKATISPRFNVNQIEDSQGVKDFINVVGDVYLGEKKVISTKQIAEELSRARYTVYKDGNSFKQFKTQDEAYAYVREQGDNAVNFTVEGKAPYSSDYLARILDPNNPTIADPTEAYKMLMAQLDVTNKAEILARQIIDQGVNATDALRLEFDQTLALAGEISKAVDRRTADYGRTLRMFGELRSSGNLKEIDNFIAEHGGRSGTEERARQFLALPTTESKARTARAAFGMGAVKDIWLSTWINGLLSSPITHAKNIAGNAMFGAMQPVERAMMSVVGKIRNGVFGGDDAIRMSAVVDQAQGYFGSIVDAGRLAGKAFVKNQGMDEASKMELDKFARRNEFDVDFGDSTIGKATSDMLRLYGKFVTLPGRTLLAEDEFFKGVAYVGEFRFLTKQKAEVFYSARLKEGIDKETAKKLTSDYLAEIRTNPTDDILTASTERAKEMTFTKELTGTMADIQRGINSGKLSPILKMFFPFVRTPTNLVIEAGKRSPLQLINPGFYRTVAKGGVEADAAIAKMTLGTTMMGGAAYYALQGQLTGAGPTNRQLRKTLEATGWQPYSYVYNKSDLSEDQIKDFMDKTPVSVGEDKVYVSYQGLQPISTLIGVSATIAEYFTYNSYANTAEQTTAEELDKIVQAAGLGVYDFVGQLPMLQGYSEFTDILAGDPMSSAASLNNMLNKLGKKAADVAIGGSPLGVYSSGMATVERIMSPERSNVMRSEGSPEGGPISALGDGFDRAWNQYTSRSPFYNDELPEALDPLTGDIVTIGKGNWGEAFNPFKNSEGKVAEGYRALVSAGVPVYSPPRKLHGYQLSAEMYNEWIVIATAGGELEDAVIDAADMMYEDDDLGKVQRTLRRTMTTGYKEALIELKEFYPDLEMHLEDKDLESAVEGVYSYY